MRIFCLLLPAPPSVPNSYEFADNYLSCILANGSVPPTGDFRADVWNFCTDQSDRGTARCALSAWRARLSLGTRIVVMLERPEIRPTGIQ